MNQDHINKDEERRVIANHVEEYLQRGGVISTVKVPDYEPNEKHLLRAQKRAGKGVTIKYRRDLRRWEVLFGPTDCRLYWSLGAAERAIKEHHLYMMNLSVFSVARIE